MKTEGKRWKWTWWLLVVGVGLRFYFVQELIAVFAFFAIGFAVVAFAILILYVLQKGWEAAVAHFTNSEDSSEPGLQAGKPARKCRELEAIESHGLDLWAYRDTGWFVRDPTAPHLAREQWTVKFPPTVVKTLSGLLGSVAKIVGVSDDYDRVVKCEKDVQQAGGTHISAARPQPYYLDVTHPHANEGGVVLAMSKLLNISAEEIATIGDMPNDVVMFEKSGVSIVMGNASAEVQAAATYVTSSNEEEGFAKAIEELVLNGRSAKV